MHGQHRVRVCAFIAATYCSPDCDAWIGSHGPADVHLTGFSFLQTESCSVILHANPHQIHPSRARDAGVKAASVPCLVANWLNASKNLYEYLSVAFEGANCSFL